MLDELYSDLILDHYKNPQNYGNIVDATHRSCGHNPLCGDKIELYIIVKNGFIYDMKFIGSGCAISQASASIMTCELIGKSIKEAFVLFNTFHEMLTAEESTAKEIHSASKFKIFSNIKNFPIRVKCATLAWHSLNSALQKEAVVKTE